MILNQRCSNCGHPPTTYVIILLHCMLRNVNADRVGTVDGVSTDRDYSICTASVTHCKTCHSKIRSEFEVRIEAKIAYRLSER